MYYCISHGCSHIQLHQDQSQLTILLNNLLNMFLLSLSNSIPNEIQKLPNIQRYEICYNIYSTRAQYSPSSWSMMITNAQLAKDIFKLVSTKRLCENVCKLLRSANMRSSNMSSMDLVPHIVAIDFNVLSALMKNRIGCNLKCCLTITVKARW